MVPKKIKQPEVLSMMTLGCLTYLFLFVYVTGFTLVKASHFIRMGIFCFLLVRIPIEQL